MERTRKKNSAHTQAQARDLSLLSSVIGMAHDLCHTIHTPQSPSTHHSMQWLVQLVPLLCGRCRSIRLDQFTESVFQNVYMSFVPGGKASVKWNSSFDVVEQKAQRNILKTTENKKCCFNGILSHYGWAAPLHNEKDDAGRIWSKFSTSPLGSKWLYGEKLCCTHLFLL